MQARDWASRNSAARNAVFLDELCPKLRVRRWRQSLHQITNQCCIYCGSRSESIDHVHPKSRGGPSVSENCVPACLGCNGRKGDSEAFSWYRQQSFYDPRRAVAIRAWTEGDMKLAARLLEWTATPATGAAATGGAGPGAAWTAPAGSAVPGAGSQTPDLQLPGSAHAATAAAADQDALSAPADHQTRQAAGPLWRWQMAA